MLARSSESARRRPGSVVWRRSRDAFEAQADALARRALRRPAEAFAALDEPGRLPRSVGSRLAAELPFDFSSIRIHSDPVSRRAARRLDAAAFTLGREVYVAEPLRHPTPPPVEQMIAHEAVHAAQQGALPARAGPAGPVAVSRSPTGLAQRTPGVDGGDSWRELIDERAIPDQPAIKGRGTEARERFLKTREGGRLVNSLWHLSRDQAKNPRFRVGVAYRTEMPPEARDLGASGHVTPITPDARRYSISVKDVLPSLPGVRGSGGISGEGVSFAHNDPESAMAETVHHELEHVEFLRTGAGIDYPTGHRDVAKGEVEPLFRERIQAFATDIDAVEKRIHDEAQARQAAAAAPAPEPVPEPRSGPAPTRPSGPPFVGLRIGGDIGPASQAGGRFGGVAGADLVLGRITSLNLGVRGIYLTPDRLLAGGTIGIRTLQTAEPQLGGEVRNPLFFDLEAGVVGQLNAAESNRILNRVAVVGSAGVGQEFGTSGSRFFWRLGGYVVISDRGNVAGGTAGVGIRFQ